MAVSTEVNGSTPTCMVLDRTSGLMAESLLVNMKMIKSMALEFTHGLMTESIEDGGRRANRMV